MISDSRYVDWREEDGHQYTGEYVYFEFKGSEVKTSEKITLSITGKEGLVAYLMNGKPEEKSKVTMKGNKFNLNLKTLTGTASFVKRLPPPNAKGMIEKGILINKKFFSRVEPIN